MGPLLALVAALLVGEKPADAEDAAANAGEVAAVEAMPVALLRHDADLRFTEEADILDLPQDAAAEEPEKPIERWSGTIDIGGTSVGFLVRFFESDQADAGVGVVEGKTGSIDVPMQAIADLPVGVVAWSETERSFVARIPDMPEADLPRWTMTIADDGSASGTLRQGGIDFPATMEPADDPKAGNPLRPQEPTPPFPYRTREVTVPVAAGHSLSGTLVLPDAGAFDPPYATAVFITGSGPQDRDETIVGHKPFLVLADHLARRGIASLRCDDRGVAGSTGSFADATTLDFADDVRAQVEYLSTVEEAGAIGLIGHSEGGVVAPLVAAENDAVAWLVLLAGTGVPGIEVLLAQTPAIQLADGVDPGLVEEQSAAQREALAAAIEGDRAVVEASTRRLVSLQLAGRGVELDDATVDTITAQQVDLLSESAWMRTFLTLDPKDALRRVSQPVLVLNGDLDMQVLADQNVPAIEQALKEAGNTDVEVRVLPGLNHLFQPAETGSPTEYGSIPTTMSPTALEIISGWIRRR